MNNNFSNNLVTTSQNYHKDNNFQYNTSDIITGNEPRLGQEYSRYSEHNVSPRNNSVGMNNDYSKVHENSSNAQYSISQEPSIDYFQRIEYLVVSSKDRDLSRYPGVVKFSPSLEVACACLSAASGERYIANLNLHAYPV